VQFNQLIKQLPFGQVRGDSALVDNTILVMKEFGYTIDEMGEMPLTTYAGLLQYLKKEYAAAAANAKKRK